MIDRLLGGRTLTHDARSSLLHHRWPGNLRELRNVLDYAQSVCPEGVVGVDDLPELRRWEAETLQPTQGPVHDGLAPAATTALLQALQAAQWNVSQVARRMGLSRMTLYRRMQRAGIVPPNRQSPLS